MPPKPNVLWIFCDQLRWHSLSINGDPNIQTPNLDRLAREGVNFTHAFSHYPVCTPFRGGAFTGQYGHVNGVRVLGDLLAPNVRTMAHTFREAGYRTGYVGKWHLASTQNVHGWNEGEDHWVHPSLRGGFEDWYAFELSNHFWKTTYCTGETFWPPLKLEGYQTDGLTDLSLSYLADEAPRHGKPWFHVLSVEAPHHGRDDQGQEERGEVCRHPAPAEYEARFDPAALQLRGNVPEGFEEKARCQQAQYYAQIANLDDNVGRVLDWLDKSGQAENTLVCFFSDHGEMGGSHGCFQKTWTYDESIRIPCIMRLPGRLPAGTTCAIPFSGIDLYPTCAALCGVPIEAGVQGLDYSVSLTGQAVPPPRDAVLIQWLGPARYGFCDFQYRALRTERYTYCVCDDEDAELCSRGDVLFDNEADPLQQENLFARPEAQGLRRTLHERLTAEILRSGEAVPAFIEQKGPAA